MSTAAELPIRFRFVHEGQTANFLRQKGLAKRQGLTLAEESLSYDHIIDSTTRDNRVALVLDPETPIGEKMQKGMNDQVLVLEVYGNKAIELGRFIDRHCSVRLAARHKMELMADGKEDLFRAVICPECQATLDLSELEETRYTYCRFCEAVVGSGNPAVTRGTGYRICEECGLFARVRGYTEFYFYFLLVVYGFSYKRRHLCDNCVNPVFWKTFLANLIFVLGVPSAIYMKIKSMVGRDPSLKELNKANALSAKGRYEDAASLFRRLHQKHADHPGLYYNEGIGHMNGGDGQGAGECFERSLKSCANYLPTLRLLHHIEQADQGPGG